MKVLTCVLLMLMSSVLCPFVQAETPVFFADPNLKAAVEQTIGIVNPTPMDMLNMTSLSAYNMDIINLNGLEYATNLTGLYLEYNRISDISPLSTLINLSDLYLYGNQIQDISSLSGLNKLNALGLSNNAISEISALSGLLNLRALYLESNQIYNISALSGLMNLTDLFLNNNQISDVSPLSGLLELKAIYMNNNQIRDISAFSGLNKLNVLGLNSNSISDISSLSGMSELEVIYINNNLVNDISTLAELTNLTDLFLNYNQISDISPLSGLTNLRTLALSGNPLNQDAYDIYIPLIQQNNPGISIYYDPPPPKPVHFSDPNLKAAVEQTLGISNPKAENMLRLIYLSAREMGIIDLVGLEYATNLWGLYLENNQISDLSPLSSLTNLKDLFLYNNQITDVSPLSGLVNLNRLGLSTNPLSDILPLAVLVNLKGLYLDDCQISDISALSGLINIEDLFLYNNQISDISPLSGLTNMKTLALNGNPLNQDAYDIHISLLCQNNPGIAIFYDLPFPVQIPTVNTLSAAAGVTIARLHGQVDSDGGQICEYRFRYRKAEDPYTYTEWNRSVTTGQLFGSTISGLTPETLYYFNAQSKNSAGESEWGDEQSFTTLASISMPGNYQAVEGFSSIAGSSHWGNYNTYRGHKTYSHWEYAWIWHDSIEWKTDRVPSGYNNGRITFVWSGANGIGRGSHDLYLNNIRILNFNSAVETDCIWTNGNYELFFDFKNHNADNAGVYYLTVPACAVTEGIESTIKVESFSSEGAANWIMVHDFTDTIEYEMFDEQLDYDHIGRADEIIAGDCSDGIQNGDETGIDCGGSCTTSDPEVCNGVDDDKNGLIDEDVKFIYGHYYVRADLCLSQNALDYVRDVNDIGYPVLVDVLGFPPEIDMYIVDFTLDNFPGGYYTGLSTVDRITGGNIALWDEPIRNPSAYPRNMCYDLMYETIHGFTHPLKYDLQTGEARHAVIGRGEDFDIIFEVEALSRLCVTDCLNELYTVFYDNASFPHFPVYYDIREKYGWEPIKQFLNILNQIKDEIHVDTDDQECYYMSISVGEDISDIYESHNKVISQETKDQIKSDISF